MNMKLLKEEMTLIKLETKFNFIVTNLFLMWLTVILLTVCWTPIWLTVLSVAG